MIIFTPTATPTATRFSVSGLLRSADGVFSPRAAKASFTRTAPPICVGVKGVDRLQASLGQIMTGRFYTQPGRVAETPTHVPGVCAWSPPV